MFPILGGNRLLLKIATQCMLLWLLPANISLNNTWLIVNIIIIFIIIKRGLTKIFKLFVHIYEMTQLVFASNDRENKQQVL